MNITSKKLYLGIFTGIILISFLFIALFLYLKPPVRHPARPNPVRYSYYQVIDESNGKTLTYVSSVRVEKGDEFITVDNKRFVVVKIVKNQAFAKYTGRISKVK